MPADLALLLLRIAMLLALYGFLLALLLAIRRDLRRLGAEAGVAGALAAQLVVLRKGRSALAVGQRFDLLDPTSLGRAPDNLIVLDDDFVSAHHARLQAREGRWWLSDVGSTNGTFLNGQRVREERPVQFGDVIAIGDVELRLVRRGAA